MLIITRPAVPADAAAILGLNIAANDVRASEAHIAAHIESSAQYEMPFVATIDGRVVGLACLRLLPCLCDEAPYAELTELIVGPPYRRMGVGTKLIRHVEVTARAGGAHTLVLMTAWRNTAAHAFYHALGYRLYTITMQRTLDDIERR